MTCDVRRVTRDVRRDVGVEGGVRCDLVTCDTVTCDVVRRATCDVRNNIKPFTLHIYCDCHSTSRHERRGGAIIFDIRQE